MKLKRKPNSGHETDTEYYYEIIGDTLYIEIQGSEHIKDSLKDWLHNFMFWRRLVHSDNHWFLVHAGLWLKYKSIKNEIIKRISRDYKTIKNIELTGYSQGAAIASYIYFDFLSGLKNVNCAVAGCPKLFGFLNYKKAKKRCKDIINVRYKNDIVTKIPLLMRSVGKIMQYGIRNFKLSIKDHHISNYIKLFKGLV